MTPKEKAEELVYKFYDNITMTEIDYDAHKRCALIAVDEIIEVSKDIADEEILSAIIIYWFWLKVKEEIEKL